jgi:hypothetical protein
MSPRSGMILGRNVGRYIAYNGHIDEGYSTGCIKILRITRCTLAEAAQRHTAPGFEGM